MDWKSGCYGNVRATRSDRQTQCDPHQSPREGESHLKINMNYKIPNGCCTSKQNTVSSSQAAWFRLSNKATVTKAEHYQEETNI